MSTTLPMHVYQVDEYSLVAALDLATAVQYNHDLGGTTPRDTDMEPFALTETDMQNHTIVDADGDFGPPGTCYTFAQWLTFLSAEDRNTDPYVFAVYEG